MVFCGLLGSSLGVSAFDFVQDLGPEFCRVERVLAFAKKFRFLGWSGRRAWDCSE